MKFFALSCLGVALLPAFFAQTKPIQAPVPGASRPQLAELERLVNAKNYPAAREWLLARIAENPKSAETWALTGRIAYLFQKKQDTIEAYQQAEKLGPLQPDDRFTFAMALQLSGRREDAKSQLGRLRAENPQNPVYHYWFGRTEVDLQRYEAALPSLLKAIELKPDYIKAYETLGLCYEALGQEQEALDLYDRALAHNPQGSPWPAIHKGALLEKQGKLSEAEPLLKAAAASKPPLPQSHYRYGMVLQKLGKETEAETEFRASISLNRNYPEPYYALGRLLAKKGQEAESKQMLEIFQKLQKDLQPTRR